MTFKPYMVSVDFNFEGQKNKYKEEIDRLRMQGGYRDEPARASNNHPYDFKCSFPGVKVGDLLVVKCATGYQVVKATKVSHPDRMPEHATARIVAKLDLPGIARHEQSAQAYEDLLVDIDQALKDEAERKHFEKLKKKAKKDNPALFELLAMKDILEGKQSVTYVRERESE